MWIQHSMSPVQNPRKKGTQNREMVRAEKRIVFGRGGQIFCENIKFQLKVSNLGGHLKGALGYVNDYEKHWVGHIPSYYP